MVKYEPNPQEYETVSLLGRCFGNIGTVLLAKHKSNTLVAVKEFDLEKIYDYDHLAEIQQEIILTRQLKHPNVISFECCYVDHHSICVVSHLYGFGSCTDLIASHFPNGLPELAIAMVMNDVLNGLSYIHKRGYVHRAVRGSHILLAANGRAVLSGLRYATSTVKDGKRLRQMHSFPSSTAANLNWLSPELLEQNLDGYNEKSDIYSVGITCAELANGCVPFSGVSSTLMLTEKVKGCAPQLLDCTTYGVFENEIGGENGGEENVLNCNVISPSNLAVSNKKFTESFHQFTDLCLLRDPNMRPSAIQLKNHSFFKQIKPKNLADMCQLLHPVIPLCDESIQGDSDDLKAILANSNKMAEINIANVDWEF